ncbi:hypothetical protein ACLQ24_19950 [Micromonospora sp. DT4]
MTERQVLYLVVCAAGPAEHINGCRLLASFGDMHRAYINAPRSVFNG